TCVPGGGDECLKELERAVKQDDARAVIINSSHQGRYPDEDAAKPFFKLVCDLDIPVFVHPGDSTTPATTDYRLASSISRPADNVPPRGGAGGARLLEAFPKAKPRGHPSGGGLLGGYGPQGLPQNSADFRFFPRPFGADADQAPAEPLPENDVFRFCELHAA